MAPKYPGLPQVTDPATAKVVKALMDRIAALEAQTGDIGTLSQALSAPLQAGGQQLKALALPTDPSDVVTLEYLQRYVDARFTGVTAANAGLPAPIPPPTPPKPPPPVVPCATDLTVGQPHGVPASPNLRWFRCNSFGVRVPGLPVVTGGSASDPALVLSWNYDRYGPSDRANIRAAMHARGYTHYKLSWPDSHILGGTDVPTYVALAQELAADGFYVGHFFASKDYSPHDLGSLFADIDPVIAGLQAAGNCMHWASVGWELSLWLSPTETQALIDHIAPQVVPGTNLYVHFQQGYISWQQGGHPGADFWNPNVGKLTGLLYQGITVPALPDCPGRQDNIKDGLTRFAGNDGYSTDSGFGHPFDYVAYETAASAQFNNGMSEAAGDGVGFEDICTPAQSGPAGLVGCSGFGNGCITRAGNRV